MKLLLTLLLPLCLATVAFAQKTFEGEVTYSINVKSKNPDFDSKRLNELIGTEQHYYVKGGAYKNTYNGKTNGWQIYPNKSKRLYFKLANQDIVNWLDATANKDTISNIVPDKNDTTILGHKCHKLTFVCSTGKQVYYFDPQFAMDPELYINAKFSNWYAFLKTARSIALKEVFDTKFSTITLTAIKIEPKKIPDSTFYLPKGALVSKNPIK